MFTFAEEVDTFVKGSKAAGGDKTDMLRIAWDNGEYGQDFKSANTFKGSVRMFYNILLTGSPNQLDRCFPNVENGMITCFSFCPILNQEFAEMQDKHYGTTADTLYFSDSLIYREYCRGDTVVIHERGVERRGTDNPMSVPPLLSI